MNVLIKLFDFKMRRFVFLFVFDECDDSLNTIKCCAYTCMEIGLLYTVITTVNIYNLDS